MPPPRDPKDNPIEMVESPPGSGRFRQSRRQPRQRFGSPTARVAVVQAPLDSDPAADALAVESGGPPDVEHRCFICQRATDVGAVAPGPLRIFFPNPVPLCRFCMASGDIVWIWIRDNVLNNRNGSR